MSAVAISSDGLYVCFADKFGVIWVVNLEEKDGEFSSVNEKAAPMLSHYCSIITSLVSHSLNFQIIFYLPFLVKIYTVQASPSTGTIFKAIRLYAHCS